MCFSLKRTDSYYSGEKLKVTMDGRCLTAVIFVCLVLIVCITGAASIVDSQMTQARIERLVKSGVDPIKASCAISVYDNSGKQKEACK